MSRAKHHVRRRHNRFHFRQKVPADIKARVGKFELTIPLKTSELVIARRLGKLASARLDGLFAMTRQDASFDASEIDNILRAYVESCLRHFSVDARGRPWPSLEEIDAQIERRKIVWGGLADDLRFFDGTSGVERLADSLIETNGLKLPKDTPEYKAFCRRVAMAEIGRLQGEIEVIERQNAPFGPSSVSPPIQPPPDTSNAADTSPRLSEIFEKWKAERERAPTTVAGWKLMLRYFSETIGDLPVATVTRRHIADFKETLQNIPADLSRSYPGMTVPEALAASKGKDIKRLAPASIEKNLRALQTLFAYAEAHGDIEKNPATKIKAAYDPSADDGRLPFSADDLRIIFGSPVYTGCKSRGRRSVPGPNIYKDDAKYWLPLLALFTGARREELAQMMPKSLLLSCADFYV